MFVQDLSEEDPPDSHDGGNFLFFFFNFRQKQGKFGKGNEVRQKLSYLGWQIQRGGRGRRKKKCKGRLLGKMSITKFGIACTSNPGERERERRKNYVEN